MHTTPIILLIEAKISNNAYTKTSTKRNKDLTDVIGNV